jgi:hypothetical protein
MPGANTSNVKYDQTKMFFPEKIWRSYLLLLSGGIKGKFVLAEK